MAIKGTSLADNPKPSVETNGFQPPTNSRPQISLREISSLSPNIHNARKHSRSQVRAIAKSIEAFGFNAPILADRDGKVLAGHGRLEAAVLLGLQEVPVILLDHLSEARARAYMLADNKLTDRSTGTTARSPLSSKNCPNLSWSLTSRRPALNFQKSISVFSLSMKPMLPTKQTNSRLRQDRPYQ